MAIIDSQKFRIISETLPSKSETIVQYDCIPSFANIQLAAIHDIDNNQIVKPFGLKSGNAYAVVRHPSNHYYVKRLHQSARTSEAIKKLKRDLKITRHNNSVYRKLNQDLRTANETNHNLINEHENLKTGLTQENKQCKNEKEFLNQENEELKEENENYETEINDLKMTFGNLTDQINNYKARLSDFEAFFGTDEELGIMRCNGTSACSNSDYLTALCYLADNGPILETDFANLAWRIYANYTCLPCCILGDNIHSRMKICSSMASASDIIKQQASHGRCGIDFTP